MKIAILSGKGGTGKTLVSVNLAAVAGDSIYVDCDVEEPNGHIFYKPDEKVVKDVSLLIPNVLEDKCIGCRKCVDLCNFNALAYISGRLLIFDEICHSCGGCVLICPEKALWETEKKIGRIERGFSGKVEVISGFLNTGEPSGVPIVGKILKEIEKEDRDVYIDCPPGSACMVMESIKDADYCILVAEPTIFGVHNLKMVYELVMLFKKPLGVVLNKCVDSDNPAEKYCEERNIPIIGKLNFDHELGLMNSKGQIVARESEKYADIFKTLLNDLFREVRQHEAAINSKR